MFCDERDGVHIQLEVTMFEVTESERQVYLSAGLFEGPFPADELVLLIGLLSTVCDV